jgi:hypothetical protein
MKKLITTIPLILCACYLYAQNKDIEEEIKKLEQLEVRAVLARDTVILKKLWDKNFVVNNPANRVVVANANPLDRPVLKEPRISFTREMEHIAVRGDIVFTMGNETVVPGGDLPKAGQTVKRRYTNIWMKVDGEWKLVARHANEICQ